MTDEEKDKEIEALKVSVEKLEAKNKELIGDDDILTLLAKMIKQREEIYRQRNAALMSEDISERVREDILDVVAERVQFLGSAQRGGQEFREGGAPERAERPPAEAPAEEAASEPPAAGKEKDDIPF